MSASGSDRDADEDAPAAEASADPADAPEKPKVVTLYVLNINFQSTQQALRERFSEFGEVLAVYIPTDKRGKSKGYGFVEYATDEEAQTAIKEMNDRVWEGRNLRVELSRSGAHRERRHGFDASQPSDRDRQPRSGESRARRDRDRDYRRDRDRDRDRSRERYSRDERRRRSRSDYSDSDSPPPRRRRSSRRSDSD
jgi:RNA recognition motif-containing protein